MNEIIPVINNEPSIINETIQKTPASNNPAMKIVYRKLMALILFILTLLFGTIFYYFKIYLSPLRITTLMVNRIYDVKTFDFKGSGNVNIEGDFSKVSQLLPNKYNINTNYSGTVDVANKSALKMTSDVSMIAQNLFALNFDSRLLDNKLYLNIKNIPEFGLPNTDSFINQWIKIDVPSVYRGHEVKRIEGNTIKTLIDNERPFEFLSISKNENIDGINVYHIVFKINKEDFFKILIKIIESMGLNIDDGDRKTINKVKDRVEFNTGEMWIDKRDYYLRRVELTATVAGDIETNQKIAFDMVMNFSKFNIPSNINSPTNSKPIEEILLDFESPNIFLQK